MARKAVIPTGDQGKEVPASVSTDEIAASNTLKKAREDKRDNKLTEEMMYGKEAYKRNLTATIREKEMRRARLYAFGGTTGDVQMFWDFHPEAIEKQLFRLCVGKEVVVLSAVQIQKYLRWV